jgi:hypothetical protein
MKRFARIGAIALAGISFAACFGAFKEPIKQSQNLSTQREILFIFPNQTMTGPPQNQPSDIFKHLMVNSYNKQVDRYLFEVQRVNLSKDSCSVERYRGRLDSSGILEEDSKKSIAYDCVINESEKMKGNSAVLRFVKERVFTGHGRTSGVAVDYKLQFSVDNAIDVIKASQLPVRIEVNSEFNTESTYSNFIRLTRREVLTGAGQKDPVTGKIFKDRFWARIDDGSEVSFKVETYPYRNGSKVVVFASIKGAVIGDTVDFSRTYDSLLREIERIIKA